MQWTRDGFGLGDTRALVGYSRYRLVGSDDESKIILMMMLVIMMMLVMMMMVVMMMLVMTMMLVIMMRLVMMLLTMI